MVLAIVISGSMGVAAWSADQAQSSPQHQSHDMGKMSEGSMKMHEAMAGMSDMKMTGDTDKDFASMMIHHHQQAITMSRAQLQYGKNAELRQRAQKIIDDSQKDIEVLEKWQKSAGTMGSSP